MKSPPLSFVIVHSLCDSIFSVMNYSNIVNIMRTELNQSEGSIQINLYHMMHTDCMYVYTVYMYKVTC